MQIIGNNYVPQITPKRINFIRVAKGNLVYGREAGGLGDSSNVLKGGDLNDDTRMINRSVESEVNIGGNPSMLK